MRMIDKDKLRDEVRRAQIVENVHNIYLDDFFARERLNIFNKFNSVSATADILIGIKYEQMALDNLEQIVLTEIETGKLASKMLADYDEE